MEEKLTHKGSRSEKWKAYSGMAAAFLAVDHQANAQVLYTDVDPDEVVANGTYDIDFDGDGTVDVSFQHVLSNFTTSSGTINIRAAAVNGDVIGPSSSSYVYASALAAGAPIAPGNPDWNVTSSGLLGVQFTAGSGSGTYGNWPGQTAYLGCRFVSGLGTTHYAWVQLAVDAQVNNLTIIGYAFETTPDSLILAGDEGIASSVADLLGSGRLQVFPNPVKDLTTVRLGDDMNGQVSVQVLDGIGRVVQENQMNTINGTRSLDLDLSALPAGNYFVAVRSGDRVIHRKITKVG
jgi:hypothetical protein